ncbi:MAG: D-alanine--D-alanine ligase family protein [bacterium]|nr:D-alanine--D-alanine ligase family protein [bacterium]
MQTIGVFFGGKSPEHDVSIITGEFIISGLKKLGYGVMPIYISKTGEWHISQELSSLKFFHAENFHEKLKKIASYRLDLKNSSGKLVFKAKALLAQDITIDLAFPAFHGQNGEDGTIQGLFEMFNIPYVGCDVAASAVAMDKILTKLLYISHNIPTTEFVFFDKTDWEKSRADVLENIAQALTYPLFVKPARLGSSIGIAKAADERELEFAISAALHYDQRILVENGVNNLMDITCAVMGNDELTASELQESNFSKDFFSYDDKYINDGGAQLGEAQKNIIIPAGLDENTTEEIKKLAKKIYKLAGLSGISRIDFLYDKSARLAYANEINTLPGTLYHHLWKASGVEFPDLLARLIRYAEEKHQSKNELTTTFESDILKNTKSLKLQQSNKL